jgi:hypothetical protein
LQQRQNNLQAATRPAGSDSLASGSSASGTATIVTIRGPASDSGTNSNSTTSIRRTGNNGHIRSTIIDQPFLQKQYIRPSHYKQNYF